VSPLATYSFPLYYYNADGPILLNRCAQDARDQEVIKEFRLRLTWWRPVLYQWGQALWYTGWFLRGRLVWFDGIRWIWL